MTILRLRKGEERRILHGHPWIFSNEVDTAVTPLKSFSPGQVVVLETYNKRLLGTAYINPHSLIAGRLFSHDPSAKLDRDFFIKKIRSALDRRSKLFSKPFYRLVFSEGDGLPGLIIDRFGEDFVLQTNTAGMDQVKGVIAEALYAVIPSTHSLLLRNDSHIRKQEGLTTSVEALAGTPPETTLLEENGVSFSAPLWDGQKTGWFYDHRLNRARLQHYVPHQTVLDVFSYLGGFGIQAAVYGAKQVDCIEASTTASQFILENAKLNHVADKVNVMTDDAFDAMKQLLKSDQRYDVVILDPPAFVKKIKDQKEGMIAYQRLNELALKLLSPGGTLFTCSCSMHVSMEDLSNILKRAAYNSNREISLLERGHQGPDHPIHLAIPETDYLKAIVAGV